MRIAKSSTTSTTPTAPRMVNAARGVIWALIQTNPTFRYSTPSPVVNATDVAKGHTHSRYGGNPETMYSPFTEAVLALPRLRSMDRLAPQIWEDVRDPQFQRRPMFKKTPLRDLLEEYFLDNTAIRSDRTKEHYRVTINRLEVHLGRAPRLCDLTTAILRGWVSWMESESLSSETINQRISYLIRFSRWAFETARIKQVPQLTRLPSAPSPATAYTMPEMAQLYAAIDQQTGQYCGIPCRLWWRAAHEVIWATGERKGALLSIEWDWYDAQGKNGSTLVIPARYRKGRTKNNIVLLPDSCVEAIESIRYPERVMMFPFGDCESNFYYHYRRILKAARLPIEQRNGPQKIRRTVASQVDLRGGNAQAAMKHSHQRTTEIYYLDETLPSREGVEKESDIRRLPRVG